MEAVASVLPGGKEGQTCGRSGVHLSSEAFLGYLPSLRPPLLPPALSKTDTG